MQTQQTLPGARYTRSQASNCHKVQLKSYSKLISSYGFPINFDGFIILSFILFHFEMLQKL